MVPVSACLMISIDGLENKKAQTVFNNEWLTDWGSLLSARSGQIHRIKRNMVHIEIIRMFEFLFSHFFRLLNLIWQFCKEYKHNQFWLNGY